MGACLGVQAHLLEESVAHAHVVTGVAARAVVLRLSACPCHHPGRLALRALAPAVALLGDCHRLLSSSSAFKDSLLFFRGCKCDQLRREPLTRTLWLAAAAPCGHSGRLCGHKALLRSLLLRLCLTCSSARIHNMLMSSSMP